MMIEKPGRGMFPPLNSITELELDGVKLLEHSNITASSEFLLNIYCIIVINRKRGRFSCVCAREERERWTGEEGMLRDSLNPSFE